MIKAAHPLGSEEALRHWAGHRLIHPTSASSPPTDDAEEVCSFLIAHGIGPCLHRRPVSPATALPWQKQIDSSVKHTVALQMAREEEFVAVIEWLRDRLQSHPLIFKGQALAYLIYDQPWSRPRSDIDVLIDRTDVPAMSGCLTELGYRRLNAIDGELVTKQTCFKKFEHGIDHTFDVHWAVSNRPAFQGVLSHHELLGSAIEVSIGNTVFLAPSPVHSLLIALVHLIGHHSGDIRLIWLYDIHLLVQTFSESQYHAALDIAKSHPEVRLASHAALELTQRYLPAERTDEMLRAFHSGAARRRTTGRAHLFHLLKDLRAVGKANRLRFLRQHLFPTADYMRKRFDVKRRWQLPFWYLIRMGRGACKLLKKR